MVIIFTITSSYVHLAAIAVDRYISVSYPISHRVMADRRKVKILVLVSIWSISTLVLAAFMFGVFMTNKYKYDQIRFMQISCCVLIFVISSELAVLYVFIVTKICQRAVSKADAGMNSQLRRNHGGSINSQGKATIINCSSMTLSFIICTYPFAIDILRPKSAVPSLSVYLLVFHAFLNPIIYFFASYIRRCCCSRVPRSSQ